jgi:SEC-C motif-containing protein
MSFGARFAAPAPADPCPCGTGDRFDACCGPILAGEPAPTAERLMRSRYTAFATGDVDHLARTWHPRTRPADLELVPEQRWVGLRILETSGGGEDDADGVVRFEADWTDGTDRGTLRERSRFTRRGGRWVYVDGDVGESASGPLAGPLS